MATPSTAELADPTALARFGKLDVVARLVVEGYMVGQHKSPFKGSSVEFVEHRQYYPGDEIRHIDWRAFGKTGRYYVKEFEEETNLRAYLLVDGSGSMAYGQSTLTKFDYARQLAAALGYLLIGQRDAVGLMTFDTRIRERIDPAASPKNFQRIAETLEQFQAGGETSLAGVFSQIVPLLKRRSLVFILSDFFDSLQPLTQVLKQFRHARHEVILLQILAPEEEDFPFTRPTQFRSLERSRHRILVDPHRLRAVYLEQFRKFEDDLTRVCGNAAVDFHKIGTNEPYQKSLGAYLDARARRKGKGR
ncbi:MAG: DUF58 domain-containing protein [Planctomycetota bacterium]|nr:MAG: DUF58 domain-containing protein [Planctomycetota bacterium]REJ89185.1 MAG: DUF58 domain-containing protein [Planctomycetota bacterium]REK21283.1 MAG: DUF58 domain-containing protein [Planctomycetota bacterium]REK32076.1 MAG: DUF58 domain-containing protein [Planctomycetota bacterium]